jgi:hypothetical protein
MKYFGFACLLTTVFPYSIPLQESSEEPRLSPLCSVLHLQSSNQGLHTVSTQYFLSHDWMDLQKHITRCLENIKQKALTSAKGTRKISWGISILNAKMDKQEFAWKKKEEKSFLKRTTVPRLWVHSFNKHLLNICNVPGCVLSTRDKSCREKSLHINKYLAYGQLIKMLQNKLSRDRE